MPSQKQDQVQQGSRAVGEQSPSNQQSESGNLPAPSTPENRATKSMNLAPRPKPAGLAGEEPESPIYGMILGMIRTRQSRMDSGYVSRTSSLEVMPAAQMPVAPTSDPKQQEPPKTPKKNNAAYKDQSGGPSASPKCPSVDRGRPQSRSCGVRPPLTQRNPARTMAAPPLFGPLLRKAPTSNEDVDETMDGDKP